MASTVATLSSSSAWNPQDDLLLKNAVEAGASLEALAKGAVQFSRRFTLQELQDRWYSLLYDPDISMQASVHMFQLELSDSNFSLKFNRCESSKGNKDVSGKRKLGTIREQYYAMRKRHRSELFGTNFDYFAEPCNHNYGDYNGNFQEHVALHNERPMSTSLPEDFSTSQFMLKEVDLEIIKNAFPETMRQIAPVTSGENNHPRRLMKEEDCLFGTFGGMSSTAMKDGIDSFETGTDCRNVPGTVEDNTINDENCQGVKEHGTLVVLPNNNHSEDDDSEMKRFSTFGTVNEESQNVCSVFGGKQHFDSPESHGSAALCALWKTVEVVPAPSMPANVVVTQDTEGTSQQIVEFNDEERSMPRPVLSDRCAGADFVGSAADSDRELADLSDSLLDFSNVNILFSSDDHGKERTDNSLTEKPAPLLVGYLNDAKLADGKSTGKENEVSIFSETCTLPPCNASPVVSSFVVPPVHKDNKSSSLSEASIPAARERNEVYCTLNTEDTEIPCNDDIFLLIHPSTVFTASEIQSTIVSITSPSSIVNQKNSDRQLDLIKNHKEPVKSVLWPQMGGSNVLPERVSGYPFVNSAVNSELPIIDTKPLLPRDATNSLRDSSKLKSLSIPDTIINGVLDRDVTQVEVRQVEEMPVEDRKKQEQATSEGLVQKPALNSSISDQEEAESDNDIPYFSDIEAMILEMDLDPHNHDANTAREVPAYESEDAKRKIIRLEQCARSSLQRAMTSRGAFAFLYGRHLKSYIKKTEVMLGRSTDDVDVDVDLRKEGRANKVSRRQAIIKIEKDGSFFLKNIGKCSILVNGKAIATGQLMSLCTGCLIEIGGMCFIFEINEKYVGQEAFEEKHPKK